MIFSMQLLSYHFQEVRSATYLQDYETQPFTNHVCVFA